MYSEPSPRAPSSGDPPVSAAPLPLTPQERAAETELYLACRRAGLDPFQTEVVLYRAEGMNSGRIAVKLHKPAAVIGKALGAARVKLRQYLETAEAEARRFPEMLLFCVLDRRTYDERPPGVCGVTPARASQGFQGAPPVTADDPRLGQDLNSALRLADQALRPAQVPF